MSLVNNMLRDLGRRKSDIRGSIDVAGLSPAGDFSETKKPVLLITALAVMTLLAVVLVYFYLQLYNSAPVYQEVNIDIVPSSQLNVGGPEVTERIIEAVPVESERLATTPPPTQLSQSLLQAAIGDSEVESMEITAASPELNNGPISTVNTQIENVVESIASLNTVTANEERAAITEVEVTIPTAAIEESRQSQPSNEQVANRVRPDLDGTDAPAVAIFEVEVGATAALKNAVVLNSQQQDLQIVQQALQLFNANRQTDSLALLENYLLVNPSAHQSRETLAKLILSRGQTQQALEIVAEGLAIASAHTGFKKLMARMMLADARPQEAANLLSTRAPAVEDDSEYYEFLATAQLSSKDNEGAIHSYKSLLQVDPTQGKWWYGWAYAQDSLGNNAAALQAYNRAMDQENLSPSLRQRSQRRIAVLGAR
ncbi:MAG: hypothetical protein COC19_05620 [SAR86 cluster bacterium]|uniref:Uncharacterized protein n=1 Tax=SAR86 cluster bacterium TaxID=2030880 RepID=A0A2A4MLN4_9GAMM|nr:MAG: hypothetical protein COC19_05620 [SAR86 cluster bacterium]